MRKRLAAGVVEPGGDLDPAAVRRQMERVIASPRFANARQLIALLRYTVEETLEGRTATVKESVLGMDVLARGETFDPREDPIVRVQAGKLRARLKEYYEGEGAADPIRIEYPKGTYVPVFSLHNPAAQPVAPACKRRWWRGRRAWLLPAGVVAAVLIAAAIYSGFGSARHRPTVQSIAVLPFVYTGDPLGDYLADGLTDELIAALGRVSGLHVVARTSVFQYRGAPRDVREIGRLLSVNTVLEGSVHRQGNGIRVTTQLVNTQTGYQLWSATYDRQVSDTLALRDAVARDIVDALSLRFATSRGAGPRTPSDPSAYELYIQGRYFWNKRTLQGLERAEDYFTRAIRLDPEYAAAHAGLADTYSQLAAYELAPVEETGARALASARRAVQLDSDSAETQAALGYALGAFTLDWRAAEMAFSRAIRTNPAHADARRWRASMCLVFGGKLDEALREMQVVLRLDPVSFLVYHDLGRIYTMRGEYAAAVPQFRKAIELEARHARSWAELGFAEERLGHLDSARAAFEQAVELSARHPAYLADLARFYAACGNRLQARRYLGEVVDHAGPYHLAALYGELGETELAFQQLDKAIATHVMPRALLPRYRPLFRDARYAAFLQQLGLPAGL